VKGSTKAPSGYQERHELMDAARLSRALSRMAHEIAEHHPDPAATVLVGVQTRGVPLAHRLASLVKKASGTAPRVGSLDITLYRDDLTAIGPNPLMKGSDISFSIDGRTVVLVDDVLYTGRTIRAALGELMDYGRPSRIELAVVVDRGHRELPIHADYVGKSFTTSRDETVQVLLAEQDGEDRVVVYEKSRPKAPSPKRRR
jgi:pyrimidine operon attenuation protein / uracil phosphoribosyltransferase